MTSPFWSRMAASRNSPELREYHGHIFGCPDCFPKHGRYCDSGFELYKAYQVPRRARAIFAEKQLRDRRALLDSSPESLRPFIQEEVGRLWKNKLLEDERDR